MDRCLEHPWSLDDPTAAMGPGRLGGQMRDTVLEHTEGGAVPHRRKNRGPNALPYASDERSWSGALGLAVLMLAQSGCDDAPAPSRSHFVGSSVLLAADEPGSVLYAREYPDDPRDLSVTVLAGEVEALLGFDALFNPFGSAAATVVHVDAASAGRRATLELRYRDVPVDSVEVEYAPEGVAGLMGLPALAEQTPSFDPLGAVCVVERHVIHALAVRRAADGRLLDAALPVGTNVRASDFTFDVEPVAFGAGAHFVSFHAPDAGTHEVELASGDDDRTWIVELRVVREDELVSLELQTPSEDGLVAGTLVSVLRTVDGCPVLGPRLVLDVGGETLERSSGWDGTFGTGLVPGTELRAQWGELEATAIY